MNVCETFRLDGRVAIVTGGAGRIGTSLCRGLSEAGARVAVASRDLAKCEALATAIRDEGGEAIGLALDLADEASIATACAAVTAAPRP